ncbi:hypothetical protein A7U60_g1052 [Sanghuangporus baumii]|uniref:Uncharacterized protein n=1 Tax=Sanghuangporus baumii TaxID=108892 RepID=A0A9Q5I5G5_SANBA|nr:hypothetical protein A7U60_g1052 [Sanghuangporus baumii]
MSEDATTPTATSSTKEKKRQSQLKRKPPPSSATLLDLEVVGDSPNDRYPPFDLDDPFASLTELRRRRSHSCSYSLQCVAATGDLHHQTTGTAPFDLPHLSPKAFPSDVRRRYTLTVALPSPLALSPADTASPAEIECSKETQREDALAKLTKRMSSREKKKSLDRDTVSNRSGDGSTGRTSHQERHRRYTHISMLFRTASPAHLPQNGASGAITPTRTKSHYIPRKASSLSYMYTPPLTPDVSGSSSSSIFDPSMMPPPKVEEDPIPPPKSPTPSTHSFVKRLLTKRSAGFLPSRPRRKWSLDAKELPSLPTSPTLGAKRDADNGALGVPFPRSSVQASMSDVTLPITPYIEKPKTTASIIGASPQPPLVYARLLPPDCEGGGYSTAPETRLPPGAELDAGFAPPKKTKLFSFSSRSLLRSRVDLYEAADEIGKKTILPEPPKADFDEFALPTSKQLLNASSLSVVSESGVRVQFGEIWEKQKTVVIFIRHFRATACQDYVRSIASEVDVEALEKAGLKIVIVGMGSPSLITPYRQLTGTTFPIYSDPTLAVYHALGMTLRSSDRGSASERGYYIASRGGAFDSLRRTIAGATRLPLFERAGDTAQLGGEFILGPCVNECAYAHRMRTTRAHAPILDVVTASGIQTARTRRVKRSIHLRMIGGTLTFGSENEIENERRESMEDEDAWMARRRRSLVRLRKKRQRRRAGIGLSAKQESVTTANSSTCASESVESDDASKTLVNETKCQGRFSVVEEEDDEGLDDAYDGTLGGQ